jgi:hypothetical protein
MNMAYCRGKQGMTRNNTYLHSTVLPFTWVEKGLVVIKLANSFSSFLVQNATAWNH